MRIAVLIQGEPRFCKEFDLFLERLTGYSQADYFVSIWKQSQPVSDYWRSRQSILVAEPWTNIDYAWAEQKIKENLPPNSYLAQLELVDQATLTFPEITNHDTVTNIQNLWKMLYSLHRVNQLKKAHESEWNFAYDLVIRTRPDLMLHNVLDLKNIKLKLDETPNQIAMPDNTRCGYGKRSSDLMAVGSSHAIDQYCDLYLKAEEYHNNGVMFHPETLLSHHLDQCGILFDFNFSYQIDIRKLGQYIDSEKYISNFGRWDR